MINIEQALDQSWALFKKHWLGLSLLYLVYMVVASIVSSICDGGQSLETLNAIKEQNWGALVNSQGGSSFGSILSAAVGILFSIGAYNLVLRLMRGSVSEVSVSTTSQAYSLEGSRWIQIFLGGLLMTVAIMVGLICCIIPGIYLALRLQFTIFMMLDNPELKPVDAVKASWNLTQGSAGQLFLAALVQIVIAIVGIVCCFVGVLPASAFCILFDAYLYAQLRGETPNAASTDISVTTC